MHPIQELEEKINKLLFLKENDLTKNIMKGLIFKDEYNNLSKEYPLREFDKKFHVEYNIWDSLKSKKNYLSFSYYELEECLNNAIYYAQTNFLKEQKIQLLSNYYQTSNLILNKIEKELTHLNFDLASYKSEIIKAFDFDLSPKTEFKLLSNYLDIENRIRGSISNKKNLVLKNIANNIFKDDLSYTLFNKLHNHYKDNKNKLANYSFIFYSMQKDTLLISSGADFRRFLEKEEINILIDKIDSRHSGKTNKTALYNTFKEAIFNDS